MKKENFTTEDLQFIENKKAELKKMEETTHKNAELIASFMEYCKREGHIIPETLFESYFGA